MEAKEVELGEYRIERKEPGGTVLIVSEILGECVYHEDDREGKFMATPEAIWAHENLNMPLILTKKPL